MLGDGWSEIRFRFRLFTAFFIPTTNFSFFRPLSGREKSPRQKSKSSNTLKAFWFLRHVRSSSSFSSFSFLSLTSSSSHTCRASLDPCWACTSHRPLWWTGNAAGPTCWKQEVSPQTLKTGPSDRAWRGTHYWSLTTPPPTLLSRRGHVCLIRSQ